MSDIRIKLVVDNLRGNYYASRKVAKHHKKLEVKARAQGRADAYKLAIRLLEGIR